MAGRRSEHRLRDLLEGYDEVCARVVDRYGRWHAVVQSHAETRDGVPYYRYPTAAELRLVVGLALSRGASGVIYFLYSSGHERILDADSTVKQERDYSGLATLQGDPTAEYAAVREINGHLLELSPKLAALYYHGAFAASALPAGQPVIRASGELELALFGTPAAPTHLLVVNRNIVESSSVDLQVTGRRIEDAAGGKVLSDGEGHARLALAAGDFRVLRIPETGDGRRE